MAGRRGDGSGAIAGVQYAGVYPPRGQFVSHRIEALKLSDDEAEVGFVSTGEVGVEALDVKIGHPADCIG